MLPDGAAVWTEPPPNPAYDVVVHACAEDSWSIGGSQELAVRATDFMRDERKLSRGCVLHYLQTEQNLEVQLE
jgi:hypothetical protein